MKINDFISQVYRPQPVSIFLYVNLISSNPLGRQCHLKYAPLADIWAEHLFYSNVSLLFTPDDITHLDNQSTCLLFISHEKSFNVLRGGAKFLSRQFVKKYKDRFIEQEVK